MSSNFLKDQIFAGVDLIIFVVDDEDFFDYTWSSCNLSDSNNSYEFLFYKKSELEDNDICWKNNVLFKICEIKNNYDFVCVIGTNTFFNIQNSITEVVDTISESLLSTGNILAAPLLNHNTEIFNNYIDRKNDLTFLKIFRNLYNDIDNLIYFDFFIINTFLMKHFPPLTDFYERRHHNKFDDLFGNLMFNNKIYNKTIPINKELTHKPFFNIDINVSFKILKDSIKSKVYTFHEKYNPFTNNIPVDVLTLQHSYMYNLINQMSFDNYVFNTNMNKIRKLNLIAKLL